MIDTKEFFEKEAAGLVTLVRITTNALAISSKNFDQATGEELPEIVVGDTISEHKAKVVELQKQIDEEKAFITKVELLKSQNVEPV